MYKVIAYNSERRVLYISNGQDLFPVHTNESEQELKNRFFEAKDLKDEPYPYDTAKNMLIESFFN